MTTTEQQKEGRRILIRLVLDLNRLFSIRQRPAEETLIQMAVRLGQYEGRVMDATRIAEVTMLPRTSVLRHLKSLEQRGRTKSERVGRRVVRFVPLETEPPDIAAFYRGADLALREACDELSKMDTSTTRHET